MAVDAGLITTENGFPCRTLVACLGICCTSTLTATRHKKYKVDCLQAPVAPIAAVRAPAAPYTSTGTRRHHPQTRAPTHPLIGFRCPPVLVVICGRGGLIQREDQTRVGFLAPQELSVQPNQDVTAADLLTVDKLIGQEGSQVLCSCAALCECGLLVHSRCSGCAACVPPASSAYLSPSPGPLTHVCKSS